MKPRAWLLGGAAAAGGAALLALAGGPDAPRGGVALTRAPPPRLGAGLGELMDLRLADASAAKPSPAGVADAATSTHDGGAGEEAGVWATPATFAATD